MPFFFLIYNVTDLTVLGCFAFVFLLEEKKEGRREFPEQFLGRTEEGFCLMSIPLCQPRAESLLDISPRQFLLSLSSDHYLPVYLVPSFYLSRSLLRNPAKNGNASSFCSKVVRLRVVRSRQEGREERTRGGSEREGQNENATSGKQEKDEK